MLERTAFINEMHALADRFNRKVSDEMVRRYYEDLNHIPTQDFLLAARTIYRNDTFWPAPARFLEILGMDPASEAEAAWEHALAEASNGTGQPWSAYPPAHAAALRAVGGTATLGRTNQDQLAWKKREFIKAFKQHAERGPLPALEKPEPIEIAGVL
jgi:hypothetical protein